MRGAKWLPIEMIRPGFSPFYSTRHKLPLDWKQSSGQLHDLLPFSERTL